MTKHEKMTQMLSEDGIDVAAGMTDEFATKYAKFHYRINRDIYRGTGEAASLDLKYEYDITEPLRFDFHPIDDAAVKVRRCILQDPLFGSDRRLFRQEFESPTLKIFLPNATIEFSSLSSDNQLASLKLSIYVEAYLFLTSTSPKDYSIRVISVDIEIEEQKLLVNTLDNSGCALDILIEHILEHVLKDRLNRFIQTVDLPQPQDFVTVLDTELRRAEILDNHLYLGLHAVGPKASERPSHALANFLMPEELVKGSDALEPSVEHAEHEAEALIDVEKVVPRIPGTLKAIKLVDNANEFPDGDIFVAMSERAFQLLADKNLNIEQGGEGRKDTSSWYYFYRYWMKVWQPVVNLRESALLFRAELAGGAAGGAGLKGCSSWAKVEVGADARAEPYCHGRAGFYVKGKEFWVWPQSFPFVIRAKAWMKPWVPGLNFVLSIIASSLLSLFSGIVLPLLTLGLRKKLLTLPGTVPGTNVPMDARFSGFGNWEGKLFAAVAVDFPD